jgi:4-hydroxybutyrate dehydrogenase
MAPLPMLLPKLVMYPGARAQLPEELNAIGIARPWILTDPGIVRAGVADQVQSALCDLSFVMDDGVAENPAVGVIDAAAARFAISGCDGIVALGGGSVLDTAKGVAILASLGGGMADYLGRPNLITGPLVPLLAMPTTAGSGSESSPAAGVHPCDGERARGTRSPFLVPRTSIADAELTIGLSAGLTGATGLDALSHCIEGFLAGVHAPVLDALALAGIGRVSRFLVRAVADGGDIEAREQLLCASFEGGAAIAKGLGPAHALANSLGDRGLHHGALVAASLVPVLERAERLAPGRMATIAIAAGVTSGGVSQWVGELADRVGVPLSVPAERFADASRAEIAEACACSPFNLSTELPVSAAEYGGWLDSILR